VYAITGLVLGGVGYAFGPRLLAQVKDLSAIMGKTIGLRPLSIILALIAGGRIAGIPGVYFSVPTAAVLRIIFLEYYSYRNSSAPAA
jgi:hypothetical protein